MLRANLVIGCLIALVPYFSAPVIASEMEIADNPARPMASGRPSSLINFQPPAGYVDFPSHVVPCDRPSRTLRVRRLQFCDALSVADREPVRPVVRVPGVIRYRVLVEENLAHHAAGFVGRVQAILASDTGWARKGVRFLAVTRQAHLTILLANPGSVDRLCRPLRTGGRLSCALAGRAIINVTRWREGAETWGHDVQGYHHYLINHEVGHVLGLRHARCPGPGAPAPIMLPQTRFLNGCAANGAATPRDLAMLTRILPRLERRLMGRETRRVRRSTRRRIRRKTRSARRASLHRKRRARQRSRRR